MKYYLLSGMDENNNYNFYHNIVEMLRKDLKRFNRIVYIPTYPNDIEKCMILKKSEKFSNIGIYFDESIVLNYSYTKEEIEKIISENELFFLYGGNPYTQIEFIKKYNIADLIKEKVIIALSAGSINMCKNAICTKDEDFCTSNMYEGMGLINFSFEPHFNINNKEVLEDLINFSKKCEIYALEDDAFIVVDDKNISFFGNVYYIKDGKIKKQE